MQITFHLPVVVFGNPGKTNNPRHVVGTVPVVQHVPVLTSLDAPVAVEITDEDQNGLSRKEALIGYQGGLFRKRSGSPSSDMRVTLRGGRDKESLFADVTKAVVDTAVDPVYKKSRSLSVIKTLVSPASLAEYIADWDMQDYDYETLEKQAMQPGCEQRVADQVESFRRSIANLVIVDGNFYLPEPEPVFALKEYILGGASITIRRGKEADEFAGIGNSNAGRELRAFGYWRLDQEDQMNRDACVLGNGGQIVSFVSDVKVYDGSILRRNGDAMTLCELAATFADRFLATVLEEDLSIEEKRATLGNALAKMPLEHLVVFRSLVNGIEAFKRDGDTVELEQAVFAIMDSAHGDLKRFQFVYQGNVSRVAEEIARRWTDREVVIDDRLTARHGNANGMAI